ncbi:MAG: ABC transporter, permease protein [Cytophagales bacterium]|nr:ABC transporter permease [Bacteroidota bacterium]MBS1982405.1 ABC transporter permease [Bacteroidota bacterium]WHZ06660.1 MAG: ABC transporter, permease protein [Cytophagales bacterium]
MNISYFISKRIRKSESGSFSSTIHKVAVVTIAIGLSAAIVSFLIMLGFQSGVKEKMYGFSHHLLITKFTMNNAVAEQPFNYDIDLYKNPGKLPFIKHIQEYGHKPGLIKTDNEVLGIVFKGVAKSFDRLAFNENIVEGKFIAFSDSGYSHEIVISRIIANKIRANVGDAIILHFFQNPPRYRKLKIVGIYETNLSDYFDSRVVIGDLRLVQQLNGWSANQAGGLEVQIDLNYYSGFELWKKEIAGYSNAISERIINNPEEPNKFARTLSAIWNFSFDHDRAALDDAQQQIGESMDYDLNIETVRDKYVQVFEWLDLVKRQVHILLTIILIVVSVNMISVILILVMERTPMVGLLKAMGASNKLVRSVFVYNGMSLVAKGLMIGNIIGVGFCLMQSQFHWVKLNPHDYYMSYVPVEWSWFTVIALNLIVFAVVSVVLLLPARFISRIQPVQAIRFD